MGQYRHNILNKVYIKNYSEEDKISIIAILAYLWKDLDEKERLRLFEWRYEKNPYKNKSLIFLAMLEDKIVGFRAHLTQHFLIFNKKITIISPTDTLVHPDYRRLGIMSMLNKHSIDIIHLKYPADSILLNTTTSRLAIGSYLKFDWYPCSNKNREYCYRVSFINFFKSLIKRDVKNNINNRTSFTEDKLIFEIDYRPNKEKILELITNNIVSNKFTNIRDKVYFDWYYSFESYKYTFIVCYLNKMVVGYTILKKSSKYQFNIHEYLAIDTKVLRLMLKGIQKNMKIMTLRKIVFSKEDEQRMKYCGFFVESNFLTKILKKQRFPVLVRPTKPNVSNDDFFIEGIDIRDIENWQLYQSDRH